jgi:hypothetical protein
MSEARGLRSHFGTVNNRQHLHITTSSANRAKKKNQMDAKEMISTTSMCES